METKRTLQEFLRPGAWIRDRKTPRTSEGHYGACLAGAGPRPDCPYAAEDGCPLGEDLDAAAA